MVNIPDRENLESMSRTDIQKLCKDNNIKANMRTDEMINALCDLVNGRDVPRPHRSMSERVASQPPPKSRLSSVQPTAKAVEISAKKIALQPSEPNTDAESVADAPVSAPTTRRKAKDLQSHLGKGRPVIAGGSGARNITKVVSRGSGRKGKASAMLQEDPIPEEDENVGSAEARPDQYVEGSNTNPAMRPSVRPLSPITAAPVGSCDDDQPSQLPTPAPSHPSYTLPSAQLTALESRVNQLESPNLAARLSQVEAVLTDIPILKASVAQLPALQDEIKRLETVQQTLESELEQWAKSHAELKIQATSLEVHIKGLAVENDTLKDRVKDLETRLYDLEDAAKDASMTSVIIHSLEAKESEEFGKDVEKKGKGAEKEAAVGAGTATITKPIVFSQDPDLPYPSPSQPTLGKRARSPTETPDVSLSEIAVGATQKQREDAELAAIYRVIKPQRKKARLAIDHDEDIPPFSFFQHGRGGPSSTSTPHQRRSDSPSGFFTAGRRAPTPLARAADDMSVDIDESAVQGVDAKSSAVAGPSNLRALSPTDVAPRTPPSKPVSGAPSTDVENSRGVADPVHDPGFFGGPLPVYYTQESQLPFPLHPTTPLNPQEILERSAQFATPTLGEPWKFDATVNPANISHIEDDREPATPGSVRSLASSSNAVPPESPGDYTFRAGGRKERNDKYNPYFTPQRGPGARHRTGITPTRGFSFSLKSPAKMTTVVEGPEAETDEDGVARSPPHLRTLYGTELAGDTRFGDYGRDLGRYDWGKFVPR